jgi:membrane protease YdiL (CAAX protease family)
MSGWVRGEAQLYADGGSSAHLWSFVLYESAYASYFIGWEFFHRGFLTIGLERVLGWYAVLVVAIPFGILHVGKPMPEAYGAIVASIILGWLAIRTRSSWYGFAVHASIAVTMDVLAVAHRI